MEERRCAIYTRKSVEDGLEQEFNSLDAQREAGENYIASQKANGWLCLSERYDDGGWSGGNMKRPALKRLMEDIQRGEIDVVVVYKIDRLSRSLLDFSELQAFLDQHQVSFVAVTQDINTSTSAGRMMLNILMSFAQYERELTVERVKDKIAAAKKRGKFCGGVPMLGYMPNPKTKKLYIVPEEKAVVKAIFERYLTVQSTKTVAHEINQMGFKTKGWISAKGKVHEPHSWDTNTIYRILSSPIYAGYVRHRNQLYEGEHEAIIDRSVWLQVQDIMKSNGNKVATRAKDAVGKPFMGLLKCGCCGATLTPTYTYRRGKKYMYYFCQRKSKDLSHQCDLRRIPAGELEKLVLHQLSAFLQTPEIIKRTLVAVRQHEELYRQGLKTSRDMAEKCWFDLRKLAMAGYPNLEEVQLAREKFEEADEQWKKMSKPLSEEEVIASLRDTSGLWEFLFPAARYELLRLLIGKIVVSPERLQLFIQLEGLRELTAEMAQSGYFSDDHNESSETEFPPSEQTFHEGGTIEISMPFKAKSIGGHCNVIVPTPGGLPLKQTAILRAVNNAFKWTEMLISGECASVNELARELGYKHSYVTRILSLANLAPDIIEAIHRGEEPGGLSLQKLVKGIPDDWQEQRELFGFGS